MTEHELDHIASAVIEATKHMMQERLSWVPESLKSYYLMAYDNGVTDFLSILHEVLSAENEQNNDTCVKQEDVKRWH